MVSSSEIKSHTKISKTEISTLKISEQIFICWTILIRILRQKSNKMQMLSLDIETDLLSKVKDPYESIDRIPC